MALVASATCQAEADIYAGHTGMKTSREAKIFQKLLPGYILQFRCNGTPPNEAEFEPRSYEPQVALRPSRRSSADRTRRSFLRAHSNTAAASKTRISTVVWKPQANP